MSEFSALRAQLQGELVLPGDADYDGARETFNAMHDLKPGAVALVAGPEDVVRSILFARDHDLPLAVRGGGHSLPGFSSVDGGLQIDLRRLCRVEVDAAGRSARVGGGATWGQFNEAAHAHGLATPGGVISTTGVGGLTLGGGIGYLSRQFGLACDNVVAAELVTADGTILRCDETEHADVHWALKGGGGNFGVVTEFEFRLHPVGEILGGPTFFKPSPGVLEGFRDALATLPSEFGALLGLTRTPALPFVGEEHHGQPTMALITSWTGDDDGISDVLELIGGWGEIIGQHVGPMPYTVINTLFDDLLPFGLRNYWKSLVSRSMDDQAIDVHCRQVDSVPTVESGVFFHPINGACHDRGPTDTAFPHRDATAVVGIYGTWHEAADDDANRQWVRACYDDLRSHYGDGEYVNFAPDDDPDAPISIYGENYERLSRIKREYDPQNLFRRNQNVRCPPS